MLVSRFDLRFHLFTIVVTALVAAGCGEGVDESLPANALLSNENQAAEHAELNTENLEETESIDLDMTETAHFKASGATGPLGVGVWAQSIGNGQAVVYWGKDSNYRRVRICWKKSWSLNNICLTNVMYLGPQDFYAYQEYNTTIGGLSSGTKYKITVYTTPDDYWTVNWETLGTTYVTGQ